MVAAWRFLLTTLLTVTHAERAILFVVIAQIGRRDRTRIYGSKPFDKGTSEDTFQVAPYTQDITSYKEAEEDNAPKQLQSSFGF